MKRLTCKDASRLMSEACERPLGIGERIGVRLHLWVCDNCRRFEQQLAVLRVALKGIGQRAMEDAPGPDLSEEARERIRRAMARHHPPD